MDHKTISIDDIGLSKRAGKMIIKYESGECDEDGMETWSADPGHSMITVFDMVHIPKYQDQLLRYVKSNDLDIESTELSVRPKKRLLNDGRERLSDVLFMSREDLMELPAMGKKSADEILDLIRDYLSQHESRILAVIDGNESELWSDEAIQKKILDIFHDIGFQGLSFRDMTERLDLPERIPEEDLKKNIGSLLAAGKLEYVDYRCYRVYGRFGDCLKSCTSINERNRDFLEKRLQGRTLQEIANEYNLTRERVRQVIRKTIKKVSDWYRSKYHLKQFDEDYYRYLYENYAFVKSDGSEWLGIAPYVWRYLELIDVKQGKKVFRMHRKMKNWMLDSDSRSETT